MSTEEDLGSSSSDEDGAHVHAHDPDEHGACRECGIAMDSDWHCTAILDPQRVPTAGSAALPTPIDNATRSMILTRWLIKDFVGEMVDGYLDSVLVQPGGSRENQAGKAGQAGGRPAAAAGDTADTATADTVTADTIATTDSASSDLDGDGTGGTAGAAPTGPAETADPADPSAAPDTSRQAFFSFFGELIYRFPFFEGSRDKLAEAVGRVSTFVPIFNQQLLNSSGEGVRTRLLNATASPIYHASVEKAPVAAGRAAASASFLRSPEHYASLTLMQAKDLSHTSFSVLAAALRGAGRPERLVDWILATRKCRELPDIVHNWLQGRRLAMSRALSQPEQRRSLQRLYKNLPRKTLLTLLRTGVGGGKFIGRIFNLVVVKKWGYVRLS